MVIIQHHFSTLLTHYTMLAKDLSLILFPADSGSSLHLISLIIMALFGNEVVNTLVDIFI